LFSDCERRDFVKHCERSKICMVLNILTPNSSVIGEIREQMQTLEFQDVLIVLVM
jgi:hypothetical protein